MRVTTGTTISKVSFRLPNCNVSPHLDDFAILLPERYLIVEKSADEDNFQTIRPSWASHSRTTIPGQSPIDDGPQVEDYSDVAGEDEDVHIKARVAEFKVLPLVRFTAVLHKLTLPNRQETR